MVLYRPSTVLTRMVRSQWAYYDSSDIPYYWNLADNYVLFDHFFSSAKDGSDANHYYWVAGTYPQVKKGQSLSTLLDNVPTIFDRLQAAGVSWKFYVENYDPKIKLPQPVHPEQPGIASGVGTPVELQSFP